MACRGNDISKCQQDITALERTKGYIEELQGLDREVETALVNLGNHCREAFITDTIDRMVDAQKKLNDPITTTLTTLQANITTHINQLKNVDFVQMQAEDKAEHEKGASNEA